MTFRFPIAIRAALLALLGTTVSAAGELPQAAATAARMIAPADSAAAASDQAMNTATLANAAATDLAMADDDSVTDTVTTPRPAQLTTLVAQMIDARPTAYGDRDCLARAVYFEARGEPLEGQLAVAQVILNRVASGRFATTVCGVVNQPGQFSFDRSRTPADGRDWRTAKAIAAIAATAAWDVVAPRATAFHATRVSASWSSMHKVSTIGNHVFYR